MMQRFPEGLTVSDGRFRLTTLLRGVSQTGLWIATDQKRNVDVWVTLRHVAPTKDRLDKLTFSAYGIPPPLYIGSPDVYTVGDEDVRDSCLVIVNNARWSVAR